MELQDLMKLDNEFFALQGDIMRVLRDVQQDEAIRGYARMIIQEMEKTCAIDMTGWMNHEEILKWKGDVPGETVLHAQGSTQNSGE